LPKVERMLVVDGSVFEVACAVRADGTTSYVADFLDALERGEWERERAENLAPDEQLTFRDWFYAALFSIADDGLPPHGGYNQLRDGIWEIKHWDVRVTFFDTDGTGTYLPKTTQGGFWNPSWPDDFEPFLRLSTVFDKTGQKAGEGNIRLAIQVREEDLAHDRTE